MNNDWLDNLLHAVNLDPGHSSVDPLSQASVNPVLETHDRGNLHPHPNFDLEPHPTSIPHPDSPAWHTYPASLHSDPSSGTTTTQQNIQQDTDLNALSPHHHFDPSHPHGTIVLGNPTEEMNHWHLQQTDHSCGVSVQQSAIESLNHQHLSETHLRHEAEVHGWYAPHVGTPVEDFGKLIEQHTHVPVESHFGGTIAEIENKLAHGEKVFVGVNSTIEWLPDHNSVLGQAAPNLFDPQHFTGKPADHIVQVVGVEINPLDPHQSMVIVNDSGTPDGHGVEIPVDQFQQAMDASHGFVASTVSHPVNDPFASVVHSSENPEHLTFGCKVNWYYSDQRIVIDGDTALYYKGNSFYWDSNRSNVAGNWDCTTHQVYTKNGVNLGYAETWSAAAVLIYNQNRK